MLIFLPYAACLSVLTLAAGDEADIGKALETARSEFIKSIEAANEGYLASIDDAIKKAAMRRILSFRDASAQQGYQTV